MIKDYGLASLELTDDYLGKFTRLCSNIDPKTNRIELKYYSEILFEGKSRQSRYKFIKALKKANAISLINGFRYINPHIVNCRSNALTNGRKDHLFKLFESGTKRI